MYSLDIFICNYYLIFARHSVLYIRYGEINILYLVSCILSNDLYLLTGLILQRACQH